MRKYGKEDFLEEVFVSESDYVRLSSLLTIKKNVILQGAPGVGKTFAAKRLAYSIIGSEDNDRVEFVQFHQNYNYEDFVMGYRPDGNGGFELKHGIFYNFCKKAAENAPRKHFFIIDEINRGNLSKIFGELFMLIEVGHRGEKIRLAYNAEEFYVPDNLYIIGMMNTADRSLAMIDYALRRRFSFFEMRPGFTSRGFMQYQQRLRNTKLNNLIEAVKNLNRIIASDASLGEGFCIGHSYFCNIKKRNAFTEDGKSDVRVSFLYDYRGETKDQEDKVGTITLRIYKKGGARKMKTTGIRVQPSQWDDTTKMVINHPDADELNRQLSDLLHLYTIKNSKVKPEEEPEEDKIPLILFNIVEYDILPMLKEYWFDNTPTYEEQANLLRLSIL